MIGACKLYDDKTGKIDLNDGLICVPHHGELQFLHVQASSINEPATKTYNKIKDWASFLYQVASGAYADTKLNEPYCEYFKGDGAFKKAMLPSQYSVPCNDEKTEKWKLTTLFNMTCKTPLPSSWRCKEWTGLAHYDKARIQAAGALLHLIQDSYSQSHTERGSCVVQDDEVVAKVECVAPTMFTTYKGQGVSRDLMKAAEAFMNVMYMKNADDLLDDLESLSPVDMNKGWIDLDRLKIYLNEVNDTKILDVLRTLSLKN